MSEQLPIILTSAIVSLIASVITFFITTAWYQARKEKKHERLQIFKQLMATRGILDYESVKAINSIPVVFNGIDKVTEACVSYMNALKVEGEINEALIKSAEEKEQLLLKAMAENLDFKKIDINTINNKHNPGFLSYNRQRDEKMDKQLEEFKAMLEPFSSLLASRR